MQMYEAAVPREPRDKNIVAGKATIEKLVDERRFEKERKKKVRLIKEGIRRRFFQQGSGPGDILNFGMYEGWRFGDVYICHPTCGEWAFDQAKPKMWKLKCFKFFRKRLADLDRLLQQEESLEQVNITRVEMCGGLMEEMAAEEQQAVEECMKVGKQRIRWADLEESQIEEVETKSPERIQEKDSGTGLEKWVSYDTAVEEHEAVMQKQRKEEEMMVAGLVEMNRDKTRDWVQEKDREFKWEEWDWESVMEEDGSTREAFEPRGSKGLECQKDGEEKSGEGGKDEQEEGGKEETRKVAKRDKRKMAKRGTREERKVKSPGGQMMDRMKAATRCFGGKMVGTNKGQDGDEEDDKKQVERQRNVVRRQFEGDMRQDGDGRGWATDVWKNDEGEKRERDWKRRTTSEFGRFLQAVQAGSRGATAKATRRQR